jgi:zinc protease
VSQDSNALCSIFTVAVTGRPGVDLAALEAQTWKLLEEIRSTPPGGQEVARARNMLVTRSLSSLQQVGEVADRLNTYNQYLGTPDYLSKDLSRYDAVTPEALRNFARDNLDPQHAAVVITVPQAAPKAAPKADARTTPAATPHGNAGDPS